MTKIYKVGPNTYTDEPNRYVPKRAVGRRRATTTLEAQQQELKRKYREEFRELQKKQVIARERRKHHLHRASDCDRSYGALIREHEGILRNQERLEFGLAIAGKVASLAVCMAKDLTLFTRASSVQRQAGTMLKQAKASEFLDKLVDFETATNTLRWVTNNALTSLGGKLLLDFGMSASAKAAENCAKYVGINDNSYSPFFDAAQILYNLTPFGANPAKVAKAGLRLYAGVDVDKAKREHLKAIEKMKEIRGKAVAYHKTLAWFLELEIETMQHELDVFLVERYRVDLRLLHGG